MDKYNVLGELGAGTWGVVHKGEQKSTGRIVAIKKIKSQNSNEGVNFTAVREIKLLRFFKHENIIELVDCFTTPDLAVCLVYECAFTDLEKILGNKAIPISLADIKQHLLSLLKAISACHERFVLHRDLKPDNMLFLQDGTMKLGDFGLARMYGTVRSMSRHGEKAYRRLPDTFPHCVTHRFYNSPIRDCRLRPLHCGTNHPNYSWVPTNTARPQTCGA